MYFFEICVIIENNKFGDIWYFGYYIIYKKEWILCDVEILFFIGICNWKEIKSFIGYIIIIMRIINCIFWYYGK